MATSFWMLLMLYPFASNSQSGDDGETIDTDCWSLMSLSQCSLICLLDEEELDICEKSATLCEKNTSNECVQATMENNRLVFGNLTAVSVYKLHIRLKGGRRQTQEFSLKKIVKITIPEIENATYKLDEAIIHIRYHHEFVSEPNFEVEFWGNNTSNKQSVTVKYKQLSIAGEKLKDSEIHVRVRAKPVNYFDGPWTEWSKVKSFRVNNGAEKEIPSVLYVLLCPVPFVLIVTVFMICRWKKDIQNCILPDVPGPKNTLAQIHRQKLHLPVSFSPEIFKDFNIYPVIYSEEKQFTSDDQGDATESSDEDMALDSSQTTSLCEKQSDDDQSLDSGTSQKLLDEHTSAEDVQDNPGCQNVAALQRHSKDESYVTMSSLYKTQ